MSRICCGFRSRPVRRGLALAAVLSLTACATATGTRTVENPTRPPVGSVLPAPPAPVPPAPLPQPVAPVAPDTTAMAPPPKVLPGGPKTAADISGAAVLSLLRKSSEARAKGQYDQASSALERAVNIEPRNYFVWSALARVYLDKKLYDNAESVAMKSNSLARGNVYVELENWKIIGDARQAQGDAIGALQAQTRVDEIERTLAGG